MCSMCMFIIVMLIQVSFIISVNAYYHIGKSPHRSLHIYLHTCAGTSIQLNKQKQPVESSTTFWICVQWLVRVCDVCVCICARYASVQLYWSVTVIARKLVCERCVFCSLSGSGCARIQKIQTSIFESNKIHFSFHFVGHFFCCHSSAQWSKTLNLVWFFQSE